jgi:small subunit ribosomal protein S18
MIPNNKSYSRNKSRKKVAKKDPVCIDGIRPRPMFIDYKDLDLLSKLTNRHGRIVSRRKTGCHASSQHAVSRAIKRARFMALMSYTGG